ncbi:MAG: hypothetical protein KatS3mg124_2219 [Porticoccaceae bacterium]|nr:MAG: hypothetical protein KatS3mg124_2219 [Porticoccaceae bacterium]
MRIAQLAPLYESVPPKTYGGTERVVHYLTEALLDEGCEVTLYASGDSQTRARLVAVVPEALRLAKVRRDPLLWHLVALSLLDREAERFDVIHCHLDLLPLPLTRHWSTPTLFTLHGRLDLPDLASLYRLHPQVPLVSISESQRAPLRGVHWAATIHHGLPRDLYEFSPRGGEALVFLGRIAPEKGPERAIEIARRAGRKLIIAAKVDEVDRTYYEARIRPLLARPGWSSSARWTSGPKMNSWDRRRPCSFPSTGRNPSGW